MLDNRWQTSSREIVEFRHALTNPVTASQFRRYVSVKGDLFENDVLFWLEVQKYKVRIFLDFAQDNLNVGDTCYLLLYFFQDFCHAHNEQSAIEGKITAIINCFLDSQIPPTLQIDIPSEMAERIVEKRRELGPYVFREAQVILPLQNFFLIVYARSYNFVSSANCISCAVSSLVRILRVSEELERRKIDDHARTTESQENGENKKEFDTTT